MLIIETPPNYEPERQYIIDLLVGRFLGLEYRILIKDRDNVRVHSDDGKELKIADVLFQTTYEKWLTSESLPKQPLDLWDAGQTSFEIDLTDCRVPILFGASCAGTSSGNYTNREEAFIPIDVFGSAFFMLTRYEEITIKERDRHHRFPAAASLAYQEGFLNRPIVNEYLEILWSFIKNLWPGMKRKARSFTTFPTHDVDHPFEILFSPFSKLIMQMGSDLAKRHDIGSAINRAAKWFKVKNGKSTDPADTFQWLADLSNENGCKSAFYFKAGYQASANDPCYPIHHPLIRERIDIIREMGHEIGFHPGYHTAENREKWFEEWALLLKAVPENVVQGGRQHYLRFSVPLTWRFWDEAGLRYDSSLLFADHVGFRCGICYSYRVFDVLDRKALRIEERPLLLMDNTLLKYMLFSHEEAYSYCQELKGYVKQFQGDFTFLWHNNNLADPNNIAIYKSLFT